MLSPSAPQPTRSRYDSSLAEHNASVSTILGERREERVGRGRKGFLQHGATRQTATLRLLATERGAAATSGRVRALNTH